MPGMPGARGFPPPTADFANLNIGLFNPFSQETRTPGAWPAEEPDYHAASQAKYKAAADVEAQLEQKEAELIQLHERLAHDHDAGQRSGGDGKPADGKQQSETEAAAWEAEKELEALAVVYERLRTEADEEFARELEEEEKRGVRG